uniref:HAT C-terminal dimerisation domain-containing protein n=1 Tax=Brassica oleracea var. oleracea TaxID=109376 RepID=A0A0D3D508_BRAOL
MASCTNLEAALKHVNHSDVIGDDLCFELMVLKEALPQDYKRPLEVLNFLKGREECYPNSWIAYQILLTIPVSVATAERSFSKLKLIKSYLRSTMSQESSYEVSFSPQALDDVEGLELREDSRWARGFAVRSLKQEEDGSPIDMRSVIQDALAMRSLVVIDVVFLVAGLLSIVSARLGFQDLVFGDLTSMLIFIAFEDGSTVLIVFFSVYVLCAWKVVYGLKLRCAELVFGALVSSIQSFVALRLHECLVCA